MSRTGARRALGLIAGVAVAAGLLVAAPPAATALPPTPPPNPTDGQISAAQAHKNAVATRVGQLSGQIAQAQIRLHQLDVAVQLAEQKAALAVARKQEADDAALAAGARLKTAAHGVEVAHTRFVQYVQAAYMDGQPEGMTGTLLSAEDPNALLAQSSYQQYEAEHKLGAVGEMQRATVTKSNADAAARRAKALAKRRAVEAKEAAQAARAAYTDQQTQKVALEADMDRTQAQLVAAKAEYSHQLDQRATYNAYVAEKRRLAEIRRQKRLAEQRARQAAAERARLQQQQHRHHHGGGGGGGGGGSHAVNSGPSAPVGGSWTAAKGRRAAQRALSLLGEIYIWAGGNQFGPTDGGCTDPVAPCGVVGYDCSGLVLYAWGKGWAHYAATQYTQAGSKHPGPGNFKPGDLLFWSGNGRIGGIGHVAVYIGHGDVVQAPQSGDVVRITPWDQVEAGYFGATRPLT